MGREEKNQRGQSLPIDILGIQSLGTGESLFLGFFISDQKKKRKAETLKS
jgi:hypothetical protein